MVARVVLVQAIAVGVLIALLGVFGHRELAAIYAGCVLGAALLIWLCSTSPRRRLDGGNGFGSGNERWQIVGSFGAVAGFQLVPIRLDALGSGTVSTSNRGVVLAMLLITLTTAALVYLSSLVDWFYIRPYLELTDEAIASRTWRTVTRVRVVHRLLAVLGVLAGVTALVALAANTWIRPINDTAAGAIAALATIIAGYYTTRAAPLVAIATNPMVQITDVIELAEEFNVPTPALEREYVVIDIAWEGLKLFEVGIGRPDLALRQHPRPYDRMVDVGEIAKLLRRRRPLATSGLLDDAD